MDVCDEHGPLWGVEGECVACGTAAVTHSHRAPTVSPTGVVSRRREPSSEEGEDL